MGRTTNTKLRFSRILMDLCETRSLASITATELIETAGTARQTFYNHFADINDLICYTASFPLFAGDIPFSDAENSRRAYTFALEHRGFFSQLPLQAGQNNYREALEDWVKQYSYRTFIDDNLSEEERDYRRVAIDLYISGCVEILMTWYATQMTTPVDTMIKVISDSCPSFIYERISETPSSFNDYPR